MGRQQPKKTVGAWPWLGPMALLALLGAGCGGSVRLWADAASPTGAMTLARHQWAYDGEPVTFVLDCPAGVNYAVFGVNGGDAAVKEEVKDIGKYMYTRSFKAAEKPVDYVVWAAAFIVRGRRDWYYDSREDKWYYHPGAAGDRRDIQIGAEQTLCITCYRREVRVRFAGRGGAPRRIEMTLTKATGEKTVIPPRRADAPAEARGFQLFGPDPKGGYEVLYSPTYQEVSRAGTTQVELLVTHADGTQEPLRQGLDTP